MTKITILHDTFTDQLSLDQKDSLDTVHLISRTLAEEGHQISLVSFQADWSETLRALHQTQPEMVINLVEVFNDDGRLNYLGGVLLENSGLPYTGGTADTLYITTHKLLTKQLLRYHQLPTPEWCTVDDLTSFIPNQAYVVKPINLDASAGIHDDAFQKFEHAEQMHQHLQALKTASGIDFFAERYITGREFWIPMLGYGREPELVAPAEMFFTEEPEENPHHIIGYRAKWHENSFEYTHLKARYQLPPSDPLVGAGNNIFNTLQALALRCWSAFNLRGYPRLDIKVDDQAQPWILEINANPCLTYHPGGIVDAAQKAGMDYPALLRRIISLSPISER